jgi:hypothetical protein
MRFNIKINELQLNKLILSEDVGVDYSKNISKISTFNIAPEATCEGMKLALASYGIDPLIVGQSATLLLPGVTRESGYKVESQQRFIQWYYDVVESPSAAGFSGKAFEGLIGGVFGGEVVNYDATNDKTDVIVGNNKISVKFSKNFTPENKQLLGGIMTGFKKQLKQDTTGIEAKIYESLPKITKITEITSTHINDIFFQLMTNPIFGDDGKKFIKKALNLDDTFAPITYFMFGNYRNINEIDLYQYKKESIVNHIVSDVRNYYFSSNSIGVQNLSAIRPNKVVIKFPQFAKAKRRAFSSSTVRIVPVNFNNFTNEGTLALRITKEINGNYTTVAKVMRSLDGDLNYFIVQTIDRDNLGRKITLDKPLKEEMINQAILNDTRRLSEFPNLSVAQLAFIQRLKDYSTSKSKGLYLTKTKVSDKGREAAIRKLFGDRGYSLNPMVIQNIRKRPGAFIKNVINIYGCDNSGLRKLETALNDIFNINIELPMAQHCIAGNNPQPEAVQESVNKVLKTLNEAIEKKK